MSRESEGKEGAGRAAGEGAKQIHLPLMIAVVRHSKPSRGVDAPRFDISHPSGALLSILIIFQCRVLFWFLPRPTPALTSTDIALAPWEMYRLAMDFGCSHQPMRKG